MQGKREPGTIVIADDDRVCRLQVRRVVERAGYVPIEAADGVEALRLATEREPAFIITDWNMPGLDGVELCRELRLKQLSYYVYIILLTTREGTDSLVTALDSGADDFLSKPVVAAELLARLNAGGRIVQLERRLRDQAVRDSLTGALNRRAFWEALEQTRQRLSTDGGRACCVLVDLDHFKRVNDQYGHLAGDAALTELYRRFEAGVQPNDAVARYGGEEFAMILPDRSLGEAVQWADECRRRIAAKPFAVGSEVSLTASFGVAQWLPGESCASVIERADRALYQAKRTGRNRVEASLGLTDGAFVEAPLPLHYAT